MNHQRFLTLLSSFADDELVAEQRSEIEEHLTGCTECQQVLAHLRLLREDIRAEASFELAPQFVANLMRRIRRETDAQVSWRGTEIFAKRLVVALTVVVVFIVSVGSLNKPEQPIVMESYLSGENADSTTHRVLSEGEVSKEDILLAVTTR